MIKAPICADYTMDKKLLSFVIPCYRSELTIKSVYDEIIAAMKQKEEEYDYEIIAVNDCSPDNVLSVLREIAAEDPKFIVIDLAKNFGKHGAMMAGYSCVHGDYVVNLDDDCQCPVYDLWKLMKPIIEDGYDCATAKYEKKKEALWKRFGSAVNSKMITYLLGQPKEIEFDNFSVFKRFVCDEIMNYQSPFPYVAGLILRTTHRVAIVPMQERERGDGRATGFTFKKSLSLLFNGLTSFSVKPLRIATVAGALFALFGFIFGIYIIIKKLVYPGVPLGYSSMMSIQLFSSGIIMLILGLIGEYVVRIYICVGKAPQFVIWETINLTDSSDSALTKPKQFEE